jgi:hypothetical protein
MNIDQHAYFQAEVTHAYMRRNNLTPADFLELDRKFGILRFIDIGYETFHLTGTQGVIEEVDEYIQKQQANRLET